jgi:hypothetical protein
LAHGLIDRVLLSAVRLRLARFRRLGDGADRFADSLVGALSAEMGRRNRLLSGWDAALTERDGMRKFEGFEPGTQARLQ